jgi:Arc/MetJ family transcription regulator
MPYHDAGRLLERARLELPGFYAAANPRDIAVMDALVMARTALMIAINAPREDVAPAIRRELERATNANEQFFTDLRETVRSSPSFEALCRREQLLIERVIFSVEPQGAGEL